MRRSVWMHAWDVCGRDPNRAIDWLLDHGLNRCSIALGYHGGRLLLPSHPDRVVYEQHPGALYFHAAADRFPAPLRPHVAEESGVAEAFLARCAARGFPAEAWLVLTHQDGLAASSPQLAVTNAFGETYSHALCPARDEVRDFCAELCRQAAQVPGIVALDLEAMSFLGYEHGGLHDKRGIPLPKDLAWLLSVCCCEACKAQLPGIDAEIRARVRERLADPYSGVPAVLQAEGAILEWRRRVQLALLRGVREAAPATTLNVRLAPDPHFSMGKSTLPLSDLAGIAERATFTFFGAPLSAMTAGVAALPRHEGVDRDIGFIFHEPDCRTEEDVAARMRLVHEAGAAGVALYCFGMAGGAHWDWLARALR